MTDEQKLDYYYLCDRFYTSACADLLVRGKHDANNIYTPFHEYRTVLDKNVEKKLPDILKNHLCTITHYDDVNWNHAPDFYLIELDPSLGFSYAASGIPPYSTAADSVVNKVVGFFLSEKPDHFIAVQIFVTTNKFLYQNLKMQSGLSIVGMAILMKLVKQSRSLRNMN